MKSTEILIGEPMGPFAGPLVPDILQSREAIKNKMKFSFGGSILLLPTEKCNERSSNPGLMQKLGHLCLHAGSIPYADQCGSM